MAISGVKEIITIKPSEELTPEEITLSERSDEINARIENKEMRNIIAELKRTMRKLNLTSLSAPAIGYKKRIFCINFSDTEIQTFINPILTKATGISLSKETCTSLPGRTFIRPRSNDITVMYMTPLGKIESRQMVGMAAFVFQHELDHLDGLLLSDVGLEIDEDFENASDEEKQEIIEMYLDSIDLKSKTMKEVVENDEKAKQLSDAVDFINSVQSGETKLEPIRSAE